jgi:hypothetical protein
VGRVPVGVPREHLRREERLLLPPRSSWPGSMLSTRDTPTGTLCDSFLSANPPRPQKPGLHTGFCGLDETLIFWALRLEGRVPLSRPASLFFAQITRRETGR